MRPGDLFAAPVGTEEDASVPEDVRFLRSGSTYYLLHKRISGLPEAITKDRANPPLSRWCAARSAMRLGVAFLFFRRRGGSSLLAFSFHKNAQTNACAAEE